MEKRFVAVVMGSISDREISEGVTKTLGELGIDYEVRVLSAHRTPGELAEYVADAEKRGVATFIALAGMSAALGGTIAAHTLRPVLGVPVESGAMKGLDALLSTSQMPPGVPVGCLAVGKPGAVNAAILAAEIMALFDETVAASLAKYRQARKQKVLDADGEIRG